jgi:hypothetical protein
MPRWKHIVVQSVPSPTTSLVLQDDAEIDLNRSDYRAWYGLGQVYEMLEMHYYALYYYEHALVYKSYFPLLHKS